MLGRELAVHRYTLQCLVRNSWSLLTANIMQFVLVSEGYQSWMSPGTLWRNRMLCSSFICEDTKKYNNLSVCDCRKEVMLNAYALCELLSDLVVGLFRLLCHKFSGFCGYTRLNAFCCVWDLEIKQGQRFGMQCIMQYLP